MVDHLTGWPIAKAIPNKEATTVANAIFDKLTLEHGAPEILLSDNGKEFTNDTLAYVCQDFNIEQHFTSSYTPRSNGKTEHSNRFLKACIENYVSKTLHHEIKSLTRSYLHTGVTHIFLLVRHLMLYSITETCLYLYKD